MATAALQGADADALEACSGRDTRGWAMRRGHCRRLKADSGRESTRGRAAFSRSLNRETRHGCWFDSRHPQEQARDLRLAIAEGLDQLEKASSPWLWMEEQEEEEIEWMEDIGEWDVEYVAPSALDAWTKDFDEASTQQSTRLSDEQSSSEHEDTELEGESDVLGNEADADSCHFSLPQPQLRRTMSLPCTITENVAAQQRLERAAVPLQLWAASELLRVPSSPKADTRRKPVPHRWLQAVALAEEIAKARRFGGGAPGSSRNRMPKQEKEEEEIDVNSPFGKLRAEFLRVHGQDIRMALGGVWGHDVKLKPIPLAPGVAQRFVKARETVKDAEMVVTLHGTDIKNHGSIFRRGLLVPRAGSGVDVKHGLCHGAGIYSATVKNARLAAGFCNAPQLLVCGVIDDTVACDPRRCGNFYIFRESGQMRYVGDAIVAFDPARIAPLFVASVPDAPSYTYGSTFAPTSHPTVTVTRSAPSPPPTIQSRCYTHPLLVADDDKVPIRRARKQALARSRKVKHSRRAVVVFLARRAAEKRR